MTELGPNGGVLIGVSIKKSDNEVIEYCRVKKQWMKIIGG